MSRIVVEAVTRLVAVDVLRSPLHVELTDAPAFKSSLHCPAIITAIALFSFRLRSLIRKMIHRSFRRAGASSLDGELPITAVATSDGLVEQYLNLSAGQHAITLTVTDTSGKSDSETVAITVGGANTEPTCSITAPESGSSSIVGQSISFAGTAMDDDINNSLLTIEWASDVDGPFNSSPANTDGSIGFAYDSLSAGNHTISLQVVDEIGGLCLTSTQIVVGTPPTINLSSPTSGDTYTVGEPIFFTGLISDQEDILSTIALSWMSDLDGEFSTQPADSSGNIAFSTARSAPASTTSPSPQRTAPDSPRPQQSRCRSTRPPWPRRSRSVRPAR